LPLAGQGVFLCPETRRQIFLAILPAFP